METQIQSDEKQEIITQESQPAETEQQEASGKEWTAEQLAARLRTVNEEAKNNRKRYQEEKRKREELEKRTMAENGQYKELAEVWQRKAEDAEKTALQIKEAFAFKSVADTVMLEAHKMGCVDPEVLINLINLKELPLDENFNVDRTHVSATLEDLRKKKAYLFQKPKPKVMDAPPAKVEAPKMDLSKMSLQEKAALLTELKRQGK